MTTDRKKVSDNRIDAVFADLRQSGRTALIPFMTCGHPHQKLTQASLHALVDVGADLIELGVPFSDPMADGPAIQASSEQAIQHGVGLSDVIAEVACFRQRNDHTPIVLMGYMNPISRYGYREFAADARAAGVDGALIVDCPPEEAPDLRSALERLDIHVIHLVSPTTPESRLDTICSTAGGFVYYVALKGITGAGHLDTDAVSDRTGVLRNLTDLPIGVGFGIKTADDAVALAPHADAVVIGSALVSAIDGAVDETQAYSAIKALLEPIRQALDAGANPNPEAADGSRT